LNGSICHTSLVFECFSFRPRLRHVDNFFFEVQAGASNTLEDARTRLDPYFARVRDNAWDKMATLGELIKAQAENVKDKIETAAEDIKDHIEKTAEDVRSTLEDKMEDLKNWFQPLVSKVSGSK